nr:VaFE repeat-containing surface-anchored protein [Corynebacterium aurimucosum]
MRIINSNGQESESPYTADSTGKPRVSAGELKTTVLNVVYNGFDQQRADRAGIQKALGLSDVEFHDVTQRAIWYYTESGIERFTGEPSEDVHAEESFSEQGFKAYQLLTGRLEASDVPGVDLRDVSENVEATLNLFENSNLTAAAGASGPYQHLLSGKFVKPDGETPIDEVPTPDPDPQPTPTTETTTETDTPVTVTETVTPTTTVTETAPTTTSVVTETTGVTTTTVKTVATETTTVPGETITSTEKESDTTTTLTEPGKEITETSKQPDTTTTLTEPGEVVTETSKQPDTTTTLTEPGKEVTETSKQPDTTTTLTEPGKVVTETSKQPDTTTTLTEPGKEVTETVTEEDVTTTQTQPATTVTETAPQETVTETTTPAEATVTTTVPVVTEVENAPYIGTTATDKADGDKKLEANGGVIVDTIDYVGLKPGEEYTMKGELMEKDKDGNVTPTGIVAETTFTPEKSEGSVDVEFTVPEGYEGKTLVVFEELEKDGEVVAEHKKPESVSQTVVVGERAPLIGTIAHEKDSDESDKIIDNGKVIDKVEYTNFIPGEEYTIKGELINYRDGKPTGIKAEKTFTAEEANGVVEIEFEIPEGFGTEVLVVFETAYDAEGNKVAEHVDLNDGAQTIATGTDEPGTGHKIPKKLWGLIPLALIPFIGSSFEGSSNGSSHGSSSNGGHEAPKGEAPKGEAPQNSEVKQGEQTEQTQAKPSRSVLANTGADVWMLVLVAIVLLGIGGALAFRGRREA